MTLLEQIQSAGVVGAGGAGFPTQIKLDADPDTLIVNGAECEPLLRVDQQLMAAYAPRLAAALEELRRETGAKRGVFALKAKYREALAKLTEALRPYPHLDLFELDNFYPAGDEQLTVYEVTGRIMPEGSIPIAVGVVVLNVETLLNISYAAEGLPVTHKYLTVTGEVASPRTLRVPLGITYQEAISLAGGATVADPALIDGGPMMGGVTQDLDQPVTKTTKGLIVLAQDHYWIRQKNKSIEAMLREAKTCCCHCMLCTEVCPRHLLGHGLSPDKLMRLCSYGSMATKDEDITSAFLCSECGACVIGCVMELQPFKLNQALKQRLSAAGIKNPHHQQPAAIPPFRENKKMSIHTILSRTGLTAYDVPAPLHEEDYAPSRVTLPLKQHIGAASVPMVATGDRVRAGQRIARPADKGPGTNYHASISGTVARVDCQAIVINS